MLKLEKRPQPSRLWTYLTPVVAVVITMIAGGALFALLGKNPVEAIGTIFWEPLFGEFAFYYRPQLLVKGAPLILIAIGILAVAYILAILIRFSLSRKREYLADAGSVELTKNPDAMIRALQKISGKADIKGAPGEVREMFLYNPHKGFSGMFTTHPPIEKRIDALVKFAGGQVSALEPETAEQPAGPWG